MDTIVALSTPPGVGALAVIRLSGERSFAILSEMFEHANGKALQNRLAAHGFILGAENDGKIDEVVIIPYHAPHTYTGEDLVEINCHGNPLITTQIIELCVRKGARIARRGEFTQRAFMAGRIDLTQAEAVLDVIQARTGRQSRQALSALSGEIGEQINTARRSMLGLLTRLVAGIDFPEEVGDAAVGDIMSTIAQSLDALSSLCKTASSGRFLRHGLRVAIVGRPNAGKSSLLNRLLSFERAIVTDIPGTTRDSIEEPADLNGVPVLFVDTAGIRSTTDKIEQIGIERTQKTIGNADVVFLIVDAQEGWGAPEEQILRSAGDKPIFLLRNKIDLPAASNTGVPQVPHFAQLEISALTGQGIDNLRAAVESFVFRDCPESNCTLNTRQLQLCTNAVKSLKLAADTCRQGLPQDCIAGDLKIAVDNLSEVCGQKVSEEVIQQVFQTFCIGK